MQLGAHLASSEGFAEGHRLHRAQQRRQVVAHQHADRPAGAGKGLGDTRQDAAHQPLPDRQCVVPGRPAWLRLCPHVDSHAQRFRQDHHRLRAQMREDALPVRTGGHPARTPEDRPALHRNAGHERHSVRHRLHQGRQAVQDAVCEERGALQGHARRAMGGTSADVRLVGRTRYGTRGDPRLHRRMPQCFTDC